VQYIAQHLSLLLLLPEVRQALTKLPAALLMQLLSSEALEVDQVGSRVLGSNRFECCPGEAGRVVSLLVQLLSREAFEVVQVGGKG
jgi:hypothetical protein